MAHARTVRWSFTCYRRLPEAEERAGLLQEFVQWQVITTCRGACSLLSFVGCNAACTEVRRATAASHQRERMQTYTAVTKQGCTEHGRSTSAQVPPMHLSAVHAA